MSDTNVVLISGRLTRDVELVNLEKSGSQLAKFSVASNRVYGKGDEQKEETLFQDCVNFGTRSSFLAEHGKKGKYIFVEGRLQTDTWEDKDGGKRKSTVVVVEDFNLVKTGDPTTEQPTKAQAPRGKQDNKGQKPKKEDDIPF